MAPPTPTPTPGPSTSALSKRLLSVITLVVAALVFNWLSAVWEPTGYVLIGLVLVALVLLWFDTSSSHSLGITSSLSAAQIDLVKFCLACVVLGAIIAFAVLLIPIWQDREVYLFSTNYYFNGSELLVVGMLAAPGAIAAFRRRNFKQLLAYSVSVIVGMCLVYSVVDTLVPVELAPTFLGWVIGLMALLAFVAILPDTVRIFKGFF